MEEKESDDLTGLGRDMEDEYVKGVGEWETAKPSPRPTMTDEEKRYRDELIAKAHEAIAARQGKGEADDHLKRWLTAAHEAIEETVSDEVQSTQTSAHEQWGTF